MRPTIAIAVLLIAVSAHAIVIRDDVPDARYRVPADALPALADLPGEGHGLLIAPRWVLTAAHATQWQATPVSEVTLRGRVRAVSAVFVHPGFRKPPQELVHGDAAPLLAFLAASDDVALLELAEPVDDVQPLGLYRGSAEKGRMVMLYGKGATGTGRTGQAEDAPHRGELRRAFNRIVEVSDRWAAYRFDDGAAALPLEGMVGNGDSGGPVLVEEHGRWLLAGLASWKSWQGDLAGARGGLYGQLTYNVRVSRYADWIAGTMAVCW